MPWSARPPNASALRILLGEVQQAHRARYCSALLDVAPFTREGDLATELALTPAEFELLPNVYDGFASALAARGPRLFTARLDESGWHPICQSAVRRQTASFLFHDCGPDLLRTHLASLVKAPQPDGSRRLFRFQDSTVLSLLAPLLTEYQACSVLGPATCWLVLDVCGHPVQLHQSRADPSPTRPLRLTQGQVDELEMRLRPATIIAQANEVDSALLRGKARCEQWEIIGAAMRRAMEHGLRTREDMALFCVLSLQLPRSFDRAGPVATALRRSARDGLSFSEAIDQVPIEEWRAWDEVLDTMGTSS